MQLAKEFFHLPLTWEGVLGEQLPVWTEPERREYSQYPHVTKGYLLISCPVLGREMLCSQ